RRGPLMTFNWQITDRFTLAGHIVVHSAVACRLSPVACRLSPVACRLLDVGESLGRSRWLAAVYYRYSDDCH
ncbi:MAG: hypothetical protein ACI8Y4_004435, partial [Candidatus Poriferisodalaceae bacterium]